MKTFFTCVLLLITALAVSADSQSGPSPFAEEALRQLQSASPEERVKALQRIAKAPAERHLARPLLALLRDPSSAVRREAARAWGTAGERYAYVPLSLLPPRSKVTYEGTRANAMKQEEWRLEIAAALQTCTTRDRDESVRLEAARTLCLLGRELQESLAFDEDPFEAGGRCGTAYANSFASKADDSLLTVAAECPELLLKLLSDKNPQVVYCASFALCRVEKAECLPAVLTHPYARVRREACRALEKQLGARSVPFLQPLLNDRAESVREIVTDLLTDYKNPPLARLVAAFRRSKQEYTGEVAGVLGEAGPQAASLVETMLRDSDWRLRFLAVDVVNKAMPEKAVDKLLKAVQDTHPRVRGIAARELGGTKSEAALNGLLALLKDQDRDVRVYAINGLGDLGKREALSSLEPLIDAEDDWIGGAALNAVSRLRDLPERSTPR